MNKESICTQFLSTRSKKKLIKDWCGRSCNDLQYGSSVWDPHTHGLQEELEKVQNRAARFVTGYYVYENGSMTGILGQLKVN